MKANLRYQNGSLYEHHGAWFVRYTRRISEQDGTTNLNRVSKYWGAPKTFGVFLMSNGAGHHSCKPSIATGLAQIRE
jgi:hypothetical protein